MPSSSARPAMRLGVPSACPRARRPWCGRARRRGRSGPGDPTHGVDAGLQAADAAVEVCAHRAGEALLHVLAEQATPRGGTIAGAGGKPLVAVALVERAEARQLLLASTEKMETSGR